MPKKSTSSEPSKSSHIKKYLRENPTASANDVVEALGREGVEVKSGLVYAVRSGMGSSKAAAGGTAVRKRRKKRRAASAASNGSSGDSERGAKAQAIRNTFRELGRRARPKDVVSALSARGIQVSSSQVSTIGKQLKRRRRLRREEAAAASTSGTASTARTRRTADSISSNDLFDAKALSDRLGGIKEMRKVLDVLEKLR